MKHWQLVFIVENKNARPVLTCVVVPQVWQQHLCLNTHRCVSDVHVEHLPRTALSSER